MSLTSSRVGLLGLVATLGGVALTLTPSIAAAEEAAPAKAECIDALDAGQARHSSHRLRDARTSYLTCARETCPDAVREDCARLLQDVDATLPTIVLSATEDGRDTTDARVFLDGERVDRGLDGRSITVDPGPHVARFEKSGSAAVEVRIVAREGEKSRLVTGAFALPRMSHTSHPPAIKAEKGRTPVVPIVLAGAGLLAIGSSFYFRMQADDRAAELRGTCAPACDQAERDALGDKLVLANVSLAVGLGALAVSAVTWVLDSKR